MNVIDEWLDSEGAKQDAVKFFKTACLMQGRRCGKTAFALYQMKKYLEKHPDATVVMPYRHGYSYIKELMNSVYWNKKPPHDGALDAVRYAIEEFERKQREEMLDQAILNGDKIKEMLDNSRYGVCYICSASRTDSLYDICNLQKQSGTIWVYKDRAGSRNGGIRMLKLEMKDMDGTVLFIEMYDGLSVSKSQLNGEYYINFQFQISGPTEKFKRTTVGYHYSDDRDAAYERVLEEIDTYLNRRLKPGEQNIF